MKICTTRIYSRVAFYQTFFHRGILLNSPRPRGILSNNCNNKGKTSPETFLSILSSRTNETTKTMLLPVLHLFTFLVSDNNPPQ